MIGFMGDDGAGFVGMWSSRGRFGGTFSSPVIDLSTGGASINNAAFNLIGSLFSLNMNTTDGLKVTDSSGSYLQAKSYQLKSYDPVFGFNASFGASSVSTAHNAYVDSYAQLTSNVGSTGGRVELKAPSQGNIGLWADGSSNRLVTARYGSYIDFTGGGGYCNIGEYRIGNQVVIDANRNLRLASIFTESLALAGLTAWKWTPAYNASGGYEGKILIIP
ncbi:MAG: hypothetical protein QM757_16590 [Paludibaculum sp.]